MRDYRNFDLALNSLMGDLYAQPPDEGHTAWAIHALLTLGAVPQGVKNVLDVGCGQGFLKPYFEKIGGWNWTGVTIGEDFQACVDKGLTVHQADMTFLPFEDGSYDLIFARHVLEHSPHPVLTLMEWHRVSREFLLLITPAPAFWGVRGKNHYSVLEKAHLQWLLERAGWKTIHEWCLTTHDQVFLDHSETNPPAQDLPARDVEYRFLCQKGRPVLE
jgi:SAM-dependent methyltransferase